MKRVKQILKVDSSADSVSHVVDNLVSDLNLSLKEYNPSLVIDEKFEKYKIKKQKKLEKIKHKALKFMQKYYNGDNDVILVITQSGASLYFKELRCDSNGSKEDVVENAENGGAENA